MKVLARTAPWLARFTLAAAGLLLLMIGGKFIADPVGAGAPSGIRLTEPLALTNMRASFGAFPLGCALVAFASLRARRWHLSGLVTVAAVLGSALVVRLYGALADHTFQQSRTVLTAEALMFALSLAAIVSEVGAAHARPGDSPRASN